MSRELLIMRHAESDWGAVSDFQRTLTEQGAGDAARMGQWMRDQGLKPDYILASPAQRAKETVQAVCAELQINPEQIHWESQIYEASVSTLMMLLQKVPASASRILMVGHNPGLAVLIQALSGEVPAGFSPANLAWLAMDRFESGGAELRQQIRPSESL